MLRGRAVILAGAGIVAGLWCATGITADHAALGDDAGSITAPALATATAVRIRPVTTGDLVSVYEVSDLSDTTITAVEGAAAGIGAQTTLTSGFSVGMVAVRRGAAYVQQASGSSGLWQYPMGVSAMPVDAMRAVMGDRVASAIGAGGVVMGQTTAGLRGAQQGDVIDLVAASGAIVSFAIGLVATDAEVGGTELVMSPEQAATLGPIQPTRVLVYGTFDRTGIEAALAGRGMYDGELFAGRRIRIRRSWAPPDPDGTLGLARTKQLLGEFDYTLLSSGDVAIDPAWRAAEIVRVDFADIAIRTNCHVAIIADLQAALTEIAQSGLAGAIDLANTNSYGGCYYARFNRVTGNLGFLSRHTWGQPIDMNTLTNAQGTVPKMDCRVVRIFRKHHFAWGGNFLSSDGMHFEWVGEPRDQLLYPSKYCPNLPGGAIAGLTGAGAVDRIDAAMTAADQRSTFFAGDGWGNGD